MENDRNTHSCGTKCMTMLAAYELVSPRSNTWLLSMLNKGETPDLVSLKVLSKISQPEPCRLIQNPGWQPLVQHEFSQSLF